MSNNIESIKFTDEELKSLVSLQNRYQNSLIKIGNHRIKSYAFIEEVQKHEKELQDEETSLKKEYLNIQEDEDVLLKKLTEKYGEGSLDTNTGTFTPIK